MFRALSSLLLALVVVTSSHAQTRTEDPNIPGEAGLRAYRAQKALERQGRLTPAPEASSPRPPSLRNRVSNPGAGEPTQRAGTSSNPSGSRHSDQTDVERDSAPVTPLQLAKLKREAKARAATLERSEKPIQFRWPRHQQAPCSGPI